VSTGNLLLTTICVCNAGKSNALGAEAQIATRRRLFSLRPGRPQDSRDGGARTSRTTDFQHPDALQ
jgi:hypothetical protein